ncbi:MAG: RNA methyltransferase [Candidatus Marinimicrobia bacterium]|nr:RNA methyltransferase [Candidatus Neomarinimicrobiota bacterium]
MNNIHVQDLTRQILKTTVSLQKKKYRNIKEKIVIEGLLPLEEALRSAYRITEIFFNPFLLKKPGVKECILLAQERYDTRCYEVNGSELKQISSEVTPQGIVSVAQQQKFSHEEFHGNILLLDQLQDPGNVGTLFRIAHWFGLGGVILTKGTADVHNPKVIRASMGSFFHLPFVYIEDLPESLLSGRTLVLTKTHGKNNIQDIKGEEISPFILVIGNEARGINPEFDAYPHQDLTLPSLGDAESLNAAVATAAILSKLLY